MDYISGTQDVDNGQGAITAQEDVSQAEQHKQRLLESLNGELGQIETRCALGDVRPYCIQGLEELLRIASNENWFDRLCVNNIIIADENLGPQVGNDGQSYILIDGKKPETITTFLHNLSRSSQLIEATPVQCALTIPLTTSNCTTIIRLHAQLGNMIFSGISGNAQVGFDRLQRKAFTCQVN